MSDNTHEQNDGFSIFVNEKGNGALIDTYNGLTYSPSQRGGDPFKVTLEFIRYLDTIVELSEDRLAINPDVLHRSHRKPLTEQVKQAEAPPVERGSQSKVIQMSKTPPTDDPLADLREDDAPAQTGNGATLEPLSAREIQRFIKFHQADLDKGAKTKGQTVFYAAGVVVYRNENLGKKGLYFINADGTPILTKEGGYPVEFFDTSGGQRGEEHDFKNPFSASAKGWKNIELVTAMWKAADSTQKTTFSIAPLFVALKQNEKGYWNFQRVLADVEAWEQVA